MNRTLLILMAAQMVVLAGCNAKAGKGEQAKKIADQRLAVYTPLRRLTYTGACGTSGPLSVSVKRIITSDSATVVEVTAKNLSPHPYRLGGPAGATALLKSDANQTLAWNSSTVVTLQAGDADLRFRMEGHLNGEPTAFIINNLSPSTVSQAKDLSIAVDLKN